MGQLIIFEGLDGSGKGTQTKLTAQRLQQQGYDLRQITFPDYDSESSALVRMYLSGAFGDKPDDVNAYAASSFYAVDRYASYKTGWGEFYRKFPLQRCGRTALLRCLCTARRRSEKNLQI